MQQSRENNFNIIRLFAALMVIYVHSFAIFKMSIDEPIAKALHSGVSLGEFAVYVFFIISGYLITASFVRGKGNWHYFKARILRVYPGLIVVMLLTAFVVGPLLSELGAKVYLQQGEVYLYPFKALPLVTATSFLPDLFANNHLENAVNVSLWTLFWEFLCYIGVAVLGNLNLLNQKVIAILIVLTTLVSVGLHFLPANNFAVHSLSLVIPMFLAFFSGMLFYFMKSSVVFKVKWVLIALIAYMIFSNTHLAFTSLYSLPLAYLMFAVSYSKRIRFYQFGSKYDISYGVYIYAFVIQQIIYQLTNGTLPFVMNIFLSVLFTLPCAFLSYVCIEKPVMRFKSS